MAFGAIYDGAGVVMIGDMPNAYIHTRFGVNPNNDGKPWEGQWISDLYYTDMDGNWDYLNDELAGSEVFDAGFRGLSSSWRSRLVKWCKSVSP